MELIYTYAIVFAVLALIGCLMAYSNKLFGDVLYVKRYTPEADRISNELLVIGLLKRFYKFRFFWYININGNN